MIPANKWLVGVISTSLISGAMYWEGTKYVPYKDLGGVVTVCSGYTGKDIKLDRVYTKEECTTLLRTELTIHALGVLNCVSQPLKPHQFDAFTLFAYNVGVQGACESRAIRLFNRGDFMGACNAIAYSPEGKPAWSYVKGEFKQGLFNRRLFERTMCLGKDYV
jgi:lysozyme